MDEGEEKDFVMLIMKVGKMFYKKGRMSNLLELDSDDTFVKPFDWSSILQVYIRVLHAQDFPRIMAMDVYCNIY